jgi:lipopolysaccharide/colanic/teichoic acid biosynthesis glycosyltransferase
MQNAAVKPYYDILKRRMPALVLKRAFDIVFSIAAILVLSIIMLITALIVKLSSKGPVFYRQERVGANDKIFKILKFRTMVVDADKLGPAVTAGKDNRITPPGKFLRKFRLDEFPQMFNILKGDMTLLGTRPEVRKYVDYYTPEMMATLLIPPGMFGTSSYKFRDESDMLEDAEDPEKVYIEQILPIKMKINLEYTADLSPLNDFKTLMMGIACLFQ